jgi:hypothetical protein
MVRQAIWGLCLGAMLTAPGLRAEPDKINDLQARFDHESDPIHRAKLLPKLGDAEFEASRHAFKANDLSTVDLVFEKYRDNVRVALAGLKKKRTNAERDSNGFRQLEINLRQGIREVDEVLLRVPEEYQPPLRLVRGDLNAMDQEMLHMLFKHPGDEIPPPPSPDPKPSSEVKP